MIIAQSNSDIFVKHLSFLFQKMMTEVKEAFRFVCSSEFWRMLLFWSICLVSSYFQLLKARIFGSKSKSISGSINPHNGSSRPICVITGVSCLEKWLKNLLPILVAS